MDNKYRNLWKYCALGVALLIIYIFQTTRAILPLPFHYSFDLMPYFIAAVALFQGPYVAGILGFSAGLLLALTSPSPDGALAVYYGLLGVVLGIGGTIYMRPVLASALILGLIGGFVQRLCAYIFYYGLFYRVSPLPYTTDFLIATAMSLLPACLIYFWVHSISRRFMESTDNER